LEETTKPQTRYLTRDGAKVGDDDLMKEEIGVQKITSRRQRPLEAEESARAYAGRLRQIWQARD